MLSNSNQARLVISSSINGRKSINSRWQSTRDISSQDTSSIVEPLEESKLGRVGRVSLIEGRETLNDDMGMPLNIACIVHDLRSSIIVLLRIGEVTSFEMLEGDLDGKVGVG